MTTTERLQRIRAKCVELLELSTKRTPGKWHAVDSIVWNCENDRESHSVCDTDYSRVSDARFIAACAGPAEAGWRSTIAAISWLETAHISVYKPEREEAERVTRDIIAAWPEETLL